MCAGVTIVARVGSARVVWNASSGIFVADSGSAGCAGVSTILWSTRCTGSVNTRVVFRAEESIVTARSVLDRVCHTACGGIAGTGSAGAIEAAAIQRAASLACPSKTFCQFRARGTIVTGLAIRYGLALRIATSGAVVDA